MEYRTLGNSSLKVSAITFGAWAVGGWMWGKTERNEAVEAIRAAYDAGVSSIDTAPAYGQGASEEIVKEAITGIPRDKVQILTKFGVRWDLAKGKLAFNSRDNNGKPIDIYRYAGKESIMYECEQSLRRLGTDYIDLYQIHWPDLTTPIQETFEAVGKLIEQGKVRYAGVCNYNAAQMAEAEQTLALVSNQIPFSMVNRDVEQETVPYCIRHQKAILAYSPMERGLLTGKIKPGYVFQEGDHRATLPRFQPAYLQRLDGLLQKLQTVAADKKATLGQLVLRWTIERPGITVALAGARNATQALENAAAAQLQLTGEELAMINNWVNAFDYTVE